MADARKGESRCRARKVKKQGESEEAPDAVSSLVCPLADAPGPLQCAGTKYLDKYPGRLRTRVPRTHVILQIDYWRYNTDAQSMLGLDPWSVKHRQVATCQRSSQEPMDLPLVLSISTVCNCWQWAHAREQGLAGGTGGDIEG